MPKRVLIIDDRDETRTLKRRALEPDGYELRELNSATGLEEAVAEFSPDLVVTDILMPGGDGISACKRLRAAPETANLAVIFVSAKGFEADQREALEAGGAAYLMKPFRPEALREVVRETLADKIAVRLWGCRGSISVPEAASGKYGGNTPCVEVVLPGRRRLIFDAGTGIRPLGNRLVAQSLSKMAVCLTHYHWDHTQGLPFFKPLYVPGNVVEIYGPADSTESLTKKIKGEMGGDYFPVSIEAFQASVDFVAVTERTFEMPGYSLSVLHAFHPGRTVAYRVDLGERSVVYASDNELPPDHLEPEFSGEALRFAEFAAGASLLIHDATYSRSAYDQKRGWGHSCGETVAALAVRAGVGQVCLFHHEPDNTDADIEAIHQEFVEACAARGADIPAAPAAEGMTIEL
jgi:phosphoribosyl 1,2-cyclic phosphodiesterase